MKSKLTNTDFCNAAKKLKCEVAAIKAVAHVESRGEGFYSDGFPVILFERHKFRTYTQGKYNKTHPHLSGPQGGYGKAGKNQINKFNEAFKLNPEAAMLSCSWGKFQVMGFNWEDLGYKSIHDFVDKMKVGEAEHLDSFVRFVIKNGLKDELQRKDFKTFARVYNGPGYKINKYDTKMESAYEDFSKENIKCSGAQPTPELKNGMSNGKDSTTKEDIGEPLSPDGAEASAGQGITTPPPSLIPVVTRVIEVEQVSAATEISKDTPEEESVLTKIGNKANAAYTSFGTMVAGAIAWFSGSPVGIVAAIMGCVALLGITYMIINWRRSENKEKRENNNKLERERLETELKLQREKQAFELQKITLESAMRKDLNTVRLVPPPVEMPNSDSIEV